MWRRRRERAQAGAPGQRPGRRSRRAWRLDRQDPARVAWLVTPDAVTPDPVSPAVPTDAVSSAPVSPAHVRSGVPSGLIPAHAAGPSNGRLGSHMPSVICTACGSANPEDARFCSQCGSPLLRGGGERPGETTSTISIGAEAEAEPGEESLADASTLDALPAGTALLVVRRGPNAGSRFLLDADLTLVGRHPDSDIFLDDVTVSRRHAEFYRRGGSFTVRDVGSLNGTYVNRERIEEAALTGGDEVQVGKFRLVFLLGPRSGADLGAGA